MPVTRALKYLDDLHESGNFIVLIGNMYTTRYAQEMQLLKTSIKSSFLLLFFITVLLL